MNIGFDGKRAFQNETGLGNYSRSLISILARYYPLNKYTLFAPKRTKLLDLTTFSNIHVITPEKFPGKNFPTFWRSRWMTKDIATSGVDIFHGISNELPSGIEKIAVKKIVTVHDIIYERFPETYHLDERFVHRKKIKKACNAADTIIAISQQTKNDLIEFYKVPNEKIVVCYQSCNPIFQKKIEAEDLLHIKKKYNLPDAYFLFVSSITKRKNIITLCRAMATLKTKTAIPLVVIGNGKKEKQEAKDFMAANNIANRLIFLNDLPQAKEHSFISGADFPAIYQQASALVYPSIFEGFGLPILEALWSGLPVICSNTSSLPEAGGEAALYFSSLDHEALAEHMQTVVKNPNIANEMRKKGFEHAQNFATERYADNLIQIYKSVLC